MAVLGTVALAALAAPTAASAQQEEPLELTPETLRVFTRVHLAINDARDAFHQQIGRIHEEQAREQAREELNERIAEIVAEEEVTREQYDQFILIISLDGEARAAFEEVLAELTEGRIGAPG